MKLVSHSFTVFKDSLTFQNFGFLEVGSNNTKRAAKTRSVEIIKASKDIALGYLNPFSIEEFLWKKLIDAGKNASCLTLSARIREVKQTLNEQTMLSLNARLSKFLIQVSNEVMVFKAKRSRPRSVEDEIDSMFCSLSDENNYDLLCITQVRNNNEISLPRKMRSTPRPLKDGRIVSGGVFANSFLHAGIKFLFLNQPISSCDGIDIRMNKSFSMVSTPAEVEEKCLPSSCVLCLSDPSRVCISDDADRQNCTPGNYGLPGLEAIIKYERDERKRKVLKLSGRGVAR